MDSSESQGVAVFTSNENGVNCVTSIQVASVPFDRIGLPKVSHRQFLPIVVITNLRAHS